MLRLLSLIVVMFTMNLSVWAFSTNYYSKVSVHAIGEGKVYVKYNSAVAENERAYATDFSDVSPADNRTIGDFPVHTYYLYAQANQEAFFVGWFDNADCSGNAVSLETSFQVEVNVRSTQKNSPTEEERWAKFYSFGELNNAIAAAEAYEGTTTDVLASNLSSALTAAQNAKTTPTISGVETATTNLNEALTAALANDVSILVPTIARAQELGVETSSYEDFLVNGTTGTSEQLYNLRTAIRMRVLDKHADVFSGNEPAADDFYLYNIGTGAFFCGGSDWGAHAAIGFPGIKVTLVANGSAFVIDTHLNNGGTSQYLNYNGYCDTPTQDTWAFVSTGDGKSYFIKRANDESKMLGWNPTYTGFDGGHNGPYAYTVSTEEGDTNSDNNKWVLVTEAERNALMNNASAANPVDVSYLIQSPNYNQREDVSAWMLDWTEGATQVHINGRGDREPYYIYDGYNSEYTDIYQTVTGLRPGVYKVAVTAAYRKTDFATGDDTKARLYAYKGEAKDYNASEDVNSVLLPNIDNSLGKAPGFDTEEAFHTHINVNKAMEMGAFEQTEILVTVGSAGTLTFGIMKEDGGDSDCTYADNWRLSYLGLPEIVVGSANYTTFVAPYNISEFPADVEAYACQVLPNEYVHLEQVFAIPEDEAVVLKVEGTYTFQPSTSAVSMDVDNDLLPSDGNVQGGETIYALSKQNGVVGFYPVSSSIKVPAGKGYLVISANVGGDVKAFYGFDDEDDATGLSRLNANENLNEAIYNLAGQRIMKMQKGINIINGKKILR